MSITNWITEYWHLTPDTQWKLVVTFCVILILSFVRYFAIKIIFKKVRNFKEKHTWKSGIKNTFYVMLVIIISAIWVDKIGSFATFFGLVTAGLAIALKDLIVNIAGWLFILIRKPFELGDRIEIDGIAGDVIDVRFYQFTLNEINNWVDADQSTGRIIHVPNGRVFQVPQANFTQGFRQIWNEMGVMVTFESNWKKAKEILEKIVNNHAVIFTKTSEKQLMEASEKFMIYYSSLSPIVYTSVKDSGIMLTMRYLVDPKNRRSTEHKIWEDILEDFAENPDIDFAYPTQRIYYNLQEGKKGTVKKPNFPSGRP